MSHMSNVCRPRYARAMINPCGDLAVRTREVYASQMSDQSSIATNPPSTVAPFPAIRTGDIRALIHYVFALVIMTLYGGRV